MGDGDEAFEGLGAPRVPVRPAATLMVVRDGAPPASELEVLMVRRSLSSDFVGGAHVFPGGAVDPDDARPETAALSDGLTDAAASELLDMSGGGLAYWVAAIRECFEEAGILLASGADGTPLSFAEDSEAARFADHRDGLNAGRLAFVDLCRQEGLTLSTRSLHYFSHWITPEGANRRYDTRFFVAAAPEGQDPTHNAGETILDVWIRPEDALAQHRQGAIDLVFPTIRSLQALSRFSTSAALLDAVSSRTAKVPALLPRMVPDGHGWRIVLPGDAGYDGPDTAAGAERR